MAVAGGSWLWLVLFLVFFVALYAPTVAAEAARLTEQFGHRYVEYSDQVPAFIPRVTPFRGGDAQRAARFEWSQYQRNREWESLLGAAAAFGVLWLKMIWLG